jgi:hypothetical protein
MGNVEYEVEGPTVIVQTTTKNHLHPENETRVVPLYLDESAGQTEKITKSALRRAAGKGDVSQMERDEICAVWHDAVRLLEPAEVVIPFAERIQVPSAPLRLRRDVPRLLNLIRLVAWVHQHMRETDEAGRILATETDFERAISMVGDSFARAWKKLTPSEEKVYDACKAFVPENLQKHGFKRSHVEKALAQSGEALSLTTIKDCLYTLSLSGYLESDGKKGATGATYTLAGTFAITSSITLAGHSAIHEKSGESRIDKTDPMAGSQSGHSRLFGYSHAFWPAGDLEWPNGRKRPKGFRPLKTADLRGKRPNGRMAGESTEKIKTSGGELILDFDVIEDE